MAIGDMLRRLWGLTMTVVFAAVSAGALALFGVWLGGTQRARAQAHAEEAANLRTWLERVARTVIDIRTD